MQKNNHTPFSVTSYRVMQKVFEEAKRAGFTDEDIVRAICDAYPWGERRGHRYKAWLQARRKFLTDNDLPGVQPSRSALHLVFDEPS